MLDKFTNIPHNSMKINANNIITFTIKSDKKMNQKSMQNLTRKQGSGVLSKRGMYEIENTLLNFFQHVKNQNQKEEKESVEHRTHDNPPPKANTQKPNGGGYAWVQPFHAITNQNQENTEGVKKIFFATLTASHDSTKLEDERKLFKAFRHFTKILTAKFGIKYLWKVEKSSKSHQHFHIVFEEITNISIVGIWHKCGQKEGIFCDPRLQTVSEIKLENGNKIARYMSKQTDFEVDGKLFSMSNNMQVHKSKVIKNDKKAIQMEVENLEVLASNDRYTVFKK